MRRSLGKLFGRKSKQKNDNSTTTTTGPGAVEGSRAIEEGGSTPFETTNNDLLQREQPERQRSKSFIFGSGKTDSVTAGSGLLEESSFSTTTKSTKTEEKSEGAPSFSTTNGLPPKDSSLEVIVENSNVPTTAEETTGETTESKKVAEDTATESDPLVEVTSEGGMNTDEQKKNDPSSVNDVSSTPDSLDDAQPANNSNTGEDTVKEEETTEPQLVTEDAGNTETKSNEDLVATDPKKSEETAKNIQAMIMPVVMSYDQIPVLEQTKLPRGGVSIETKAVGRVQVGVH